MTEMGMTPDATDRMKTAAATQGIVDQLSAAEQADIVGVLAKATVATSEAAMGECVGKAAELDGNLDTGGWQTFELINEELKPSRERYEALMAEPGRIEDLLLEGAVKARAYAAPFLGRIRAAVGIKKLG